MRTKEQKLERRSYLHARYPTLALWFFVRGVIAWSIGAAIWIWQMLFAWDLVIARHGGNHPVLACIWAVVLPAGFVVLWRKHWGPSMKRDIRMRWDVWLVATGHNVRLPR